MLQELNSEASQTYRIEHEECVKLNFNKTVEKKDWLLFVIFRYMSLLIYRELKMAVFTEANIDNEILLFHDYSYYMIIIVISFALV